MSKQRQPTGPSRQHNHQQQERHRYQNEEQKRHDRTEVRGLSEEQPSDTDEEFIYTIIPSKKTPETTVKVAEVPVQVKIDTGSSVNILNSEHFKKIKQQNSRIKLQPTKTKVFAYGAQHPMHLLGQFTAEVQHNLTKTTSTFLVTKENNTCLLSFNTSTGLGLLNININSITIDHSNPRIAQILQQHHKVFQGMGSLKNCEVKLEINPCHTK